MTLTITPVLGGLGRVILGSNNRPVQIGALGPLYDAETVPGVTGASAPLLGPVDDLDWVPSGAITATGGTTP